MKTNTRYILSEKNNEEVLVRDVAEATTADQFIPRAMDHRGGRSSAAGGASSLSKRAGFPADRLIVPAKGVLIRIPVAVEMFDGCDIRPKHFPQPDLEISVAVDSKDEFLKARLNGASFRRVMRRLRDDQAAGKQLGRLFIVGRIVTPGVITDPGIAYEYV
jgi:hypothetical protein